jgi:carbon storage regulator
MLVLSRKPGEEVVIGEGIRVTVLAVIGDRVHLGFRAPAQVQILRSELHGGKDPKLDSSARKAGE